MTPRITDARLASEIVTPPPRAPSKWARAVWVRWLGTFGILISIFGGLLMGRRATHQRAAANVPVAARVGDCGITADLTHVPISIASVGQSGGVTAQTVNPSFTVQPYIPGAVFSISTRRGQSPAGISIGVSVSDDRGERKWEASGRKGDYCEYFRSDLDQCITGWMRGIDSTAFFAQ